LDEQKRAALEDVFKWEKNVQLLCSFVQKKAYLCKKQKLWITRNQTLKYIQHSILMSYACNIFSFIFNYLSSNLFFFVRKLCKLLLFDKDFEHNNFIKFALIVNAKKYLLFDIMLYNKCTNKERKHYGYWKDYCST
jgi:hypothetical protein